jgi:hypothetical protein
MGSKPGRLVIVTLVTFAGCFGQDNAAFPGRKLPAHVKLYKGFEVTGKRQLPAESKPVRPSSNLTPPEQCAHILVRPVFPEIDPWMIAKTPAFGMAKMPVHKGLPVCSSDIR